MFQKIAPLIILAMFAIGTYFVMQGMSKATEMTHPKTMKQGEK
ncbi:hypothetical protein [Nitratifractor sp.]